MRKILHKIWPPLPTPPAYRPVTSYRNECLHGRDMRGQALRGVDFRGTRLCRVRFVAADLRWADFSGAIARPFGRAPGADLRGAWLTEADLRGARLTGAIIDDGEGGEVTLL